MEFVGAQLRKRRVCGFESSTEGAEFAETGGLARARDILKLAIEVEGVGLERGGAGGSRVRAEVFLGEGYREGGVGGEIKGGIALAPVSGRVELALTFLWSDENHCGGGGST